MTDDSYDFYDALEQEDEGSWEDECGLGSGGYCSMAGTEHCDFSCPNRNSDQFRGSASWHAKFKRKPAKNSPSESK